MSRVQIKPLSKIDRESLSATMRGMTNASLRKLVADSLKDVMLPSKSAAWATSAAAGLWQSMAASADPASAIDYRSELTTYLESIACKARWSSGSVAQGIARRAAGPQFRGDLSSIYLTLSTPDTCAPGKAVSGSLMQDLASAVDARLGQ
jgi:hypothetical protein